MARFHLASRASFRSQHVSVAARFSLSVEVRSREIDALDDRVLHELAAYSTPAEVRDLEAVLDRYADADTAEIRSVLAERHVRRPDELLWLTDAAKR